MDISSISKLLEYLCKNNAAFSYPQSDYDILLIDSECQIPLRLVVNPYLFSQEYVVTVVRLFADEDAPQTVMHMALIRDCLMGANLERLKNTCRLPCWTVASNEFYAGHCLTSLVKAVPPRPGNYRLVTHQARWS